jgi:hypothetical protein
MKKQNYEAPVMEQMEVSVEMNFLGTINSVSNALGRSTTESATNYNNGDAIDW